MDYSEKRAEKAEPAGAAVSPVARYAWVVLIVVFLASVAAPLNQFKVPPLMPVLMQSFTLDLTQAGWLMSIFALTGLILALPAGVILQRLGAKVTGLIALACLLVGASLGALATDANSLLFSRVLEGAGLGLMVVVGPAAIALWFPRDKQGLPMGIWATWVPVGNFIMFNLAPALGTSSGWQAVWWAGAAFALVTLILYAMFMRQPTASAGDQIRSSAASAEPAPSLRSGLANRDFWLLALAFGCFNIVGIGYTTYFPTFLAEQRGYTLAEASFIVSISTIGAIIAAPLSGWLSDRIGSRRKLLSIPLLILGAMLLFPFQLIGTALYIFVFFFGVVSVANPTATFAAVLEVAADPRQAGIGMAVVSVGMNLGILIGPILFGKLIETLGWVSAGYALIPVCIVGFALGWMVRVR